MHTFSKSKPSGHNIPKNDMLSFYLLSTYPMIAPSCV